MLFNQNGPTNDNDANVSREDAAYIMEALILDTCDNTDIEMFLENTNEVNEVLSNEVLLEKTIVRLDKKAKLSKARKMAVFTVAKEKNDPKFKKLLWIWKTERYLEAYLDKKYGNEAMRRAKKTMANAGKIKSGIIKKAINKAKNSFNKPVVGK